MARPGVKQSPYPIHPALFTILFAASLLSSGCSFIPREPAWNFLVYMAADNNLEEYAIADLNELEIIGSSDQVAIFALLDRCPDYDSSNGDWTSARLYRITRDADQATINSELVADCGELDMSDPDTLRNFIIACHEARPAPRTCLTLWDHGAGVFPRSMAAPSSAPFPGDDGVSRGICVDETTGIGDGVYLTGSEITAALAAARSVTGAKIDVVNLDACLMQMMEIAWEWRDEADYLVGSEAYSPAVGNNYDLVLDHLNDNALMSPRDLAVMLVDDFYASYSTSVFNRTYSAVSLGAEFDAVETAFASFAAALDVTSQLAEAHDARSASVSFERPEYVDLYDFAYRTTQDMTDADVIDAADALMTALSGAVIRHCATNAYDETTHGLSVLLPETLVQWSDYSAADRYPDFPHCTETQWDEFIADFVL